MFVPSILYAALFTPLIEENINKADTATYKPPLEPDLTQFILYESFIPIDSLAFYIGAYSLSTTEVKALISNVLDAKKLLLKDGKVFSKFMNYSDIVSAPGEVGNLIMQRNLMMQYDKSGIFREYLVNAHDLIRRRLLEKKNIRERFLPDFPISSSGKASSNSNIKSNLISDKLNTKSFLTETRNIENEINKLNLLREVINSKETKKVPKAKSRDTLYREMILRIFNDIYEDQNINSRLSWEKDEFYREFSIISAERIMRAKISLSLGGAFISPSSLLYMVNRLNIQKKKEKVREVLTELFKVTEELELKTRTKPFTDQKQIVLEFLENLYDKKHRKYDQAFEARSILMKLSIPESIDSENETQEKYVKELVDAISNFKREDWILKYNPAILEDLLIYLLSNQEEDKERLLEHFKS